MVVPVRYGDLDEVKELLQTLVPDVTYEVIRQPPGLRLKGEPGAIEQVIELLGEFDRPPARLDLEVTLVDTHGYMGSPGSSFAIAAAASLPREFLEVYRWPTLTVDSDREATLMLTDVYGCAPVGFVLDLKPSVKADGYVVLELRPQAFTLVQPPRTLRTSMRAKTGDVIFLGGVFRKADAVAAHRWQLQNLMDVMPLGCRPSDLAVAIRWTVRP